MAGVPDILRRICEQRRRRVPPGRGGAAARGPTAARLPADAPGRRFLDAIAARRGAAVIAEIKMGSPKLGDLRGRFDPVARAAAYADAGAACLSVVVEPDHFHGGYDLLAECAAASGLPAVAKDFVVSDVQLAWARDAGACAVLLIAALHDAAELHRLAGLARGLGLVPLIETHDGADFEKLAPPAAHAQPAAAGSRDRPGDGMGQHPAPLATRAQPAASRGMPLAECAQPLAGRTHPAATGAPARAAGAPVAAPNTAKTAAPVAPKAQARAAGATRPHPVSVGGDEPPEWELVGINNRDLRTFEVDLERSADRVGRLPASALKVAESGIRSGADIARLREAGFDAFLIGERLVLSGDPAAALAELLGETALETGDA